MLFRSGDVIDLGDNSYDFGFILRDGGIRGGEVDEDVNLVNHGAEDRCSDGKFKQKCLIIVVRGQTLHHRMQLAGCYAVFFQICKHMRIFLMVLLVVTQVAFSQKTEVRRFERFNALRVSSGIDVKLVRGETNTATIEVSGIRLDEVITEVQGNTLKISLDRKSTRLNSSHT